MDTCCFCVLAVVHNAAIDVGVLAFIKVVAEQCKNNYIMSSPMSSFLPSSLRYPLPPSAVPAMCQRGAELGSGEITAEKTQPLSQG